MKPYDAQQEHTATRRAFVRLNLLALAFPVLIFIAVFVYCSIRGIELTRPQWKTIVLITWLGTILALVRETLSTAYAGRRFRRPWLSRRYPVESGQQGSGARMSKWESRKTQALCKEFFATAVGVPLGSVALVYAYFTVQGVELSNAQWKRVALIVWVATILYLFRISWQAVKSRVIYSD